MPALSVAARVLLALRARLAAIDGSAAYHFDLADRIHARRPVFDLDAFPPPALFVSRRAGGGEQRTQRPGTHVLTDKTVVFDVIGIVDAAQDCPGVAAEQLLADIERSLELPADLFMSDVDLAANLLSQPLQLVDPEINDAVSRAEVEAIGVGVRCVWPHTYGDPSHVDP